MWHFILTISIAFASPSGETLVKQEQARVAPFITQEACELARQGTHVTGDGLNGWGTAVCKRDGM